MANALKTCPCGHRIASQCPGEWEPGCDLGANPAHVQVAQTPAQPVIRTLSPEQIERHTLKASECPPGSAVMLVSAINRLLSKRPGDAIRFAQPAAVVYPPDGTVSPFTVINLGAGLVQMGDSIHDGRLPALWFGKNGQGMGHEEELNRQAHEGETLAVVTFANVEGLDVLLDAIQRIRRVSFPGAAEAPHG